MPRPRPMTVVAIVLTVALGGVVLWGVWSGVAEVASWSRGDQERLGGQAILALIAGVIVVGAAVLRSTLASPRRDDRTIRRVLRRAAPAARAVLPLQWLERGDDDAHLYSFSGATVTPGELAVWIPSSPARRVMTIAAADIAEIDVIEDGRTFRVTVRMRDTLAPDLTMRVRRRWLAEARRAAHSLDPR